MSVLPVLAALNRLPQPRRIAAIHPHRKCCYLMAATAAVVIALCASISGHGTAVGVALTVIGIGVLTVQPWGQGTALLLICSTGTWLVCDASPRSWWSIPVALGLLTQYAAMTVAANGPESAPIPRAVAQVWMRRVLIVSAITVACGLIAQLLSAASPPGSRLAAAVALVIVAVLTSTVSAVLRTATSRRHKDESTY